MDAQREAVKPMVIPDESAWIAIVRLSGPARAGHRELGRVSRERPLTAVDE
jgi:hypothetical protein